MEKWYTADSEKRTMKELLEWLRAAEEIKYSDPYKVIVGTDSHLHGCEFRFVTVVLMYKEGKGGNYWYTLSFDRRENYKGAQQNRMYREVEISLSLSDKLLEEGIVVDEVHLDVSPEDAGEFTSTISDGLKGYVKSRGYFPVIKPASYVANAVADKHSK
jgi:predicted RNase H-related nuclease YkuK (DUF458 family)